MSRMTGTFLLLVLLTSGGSASAPVDAADDHGPPPAALAVSVSETAEAVLLHIRASGDVEPGSVEIRLARDKAVVVARDSEKRAIRSQPTRLPAPVVEEGSTAYYEDDGALVMMLQKQPPPETRSLRAIR